MNSKILLSRIPEPVKGIGLVLLTFLLIFGGMGLVLRLAMPLF
jgi:hypothetical protein